MHADSHTRTHFRNWRENAFCAVYVRTKEARSASLWRTTARWRAVTLVVIITVRTGFVPLGNPSSI